MAVTASIGRDGQGWLSSLMHMARIENHLPAGAIRCKWPIHKVSHMADEATLDHARPFLPDAVGLGVASRYGQ